MKGTVKWFNQNLKYGFINSDDDPNTDYFVYIDDIIEHNLITEGDCVDFTPIVTKDKRYKAVHVTLCK